MSWLSELFGGSSNTQIVPPSPEQVSNYYRQAKANNPAYYDAYLKMSDPEYIASLNAPPTPTLSAEAAAPTPVPTYSGPTAEAKLQGLLPAGFENTLIPGSVSSPYITSTMNTGRSAAQSLIQNMLRRGTLSDTGRASALKALSDQDPSVTTKLTGISNTLLENERAKLRGIANEGYGAAAGQSGETFDPTPYQARANTEASGFLQGFPASFASSVGDAGALYNTAGLGEAGGAVSDPRNVSYDPYAVEGGKLATGTGEQDQGPPAQKKRSTSVF